jgi:hypothetical protein
VLRDYKRLWAGAGPAPLPAELARFYMWAQTEGWIHVAVYDPLGARVGWGWGCQAYRRRVECTRLVCEPRHAPGRRGAGGSGEQGTRSPPRPHTPTRPPQLSLAARAPLR